MLSDRSRKARENLLKKYRFAQTSGANVTCDRIHLSGPDEVTVGEEFVLTVTTEPKDISAVAFVTLDAGTQYGFDLSEPSCPSEADEAESPPSPRRTLGPPVGLDPPVYGRVAITDGKGEFRVTQYSEEAFRLRVTLGAAEATWAIDSDHVRPNGEGPDNGRDDKVAVETSDEARTTNKRRARACHGKGVA